MKDMEKYSRTPVTKQAFVITVNRGTVGASYVKPARNLCETAAALVLAVQAAEILSRRRLAARRTRAPTGGAAAQPGIAGILGSD
jgi:hypothetical protein